MSTSVESLGSRNVWEPPPAKPLDEAVWQAWVTKGRAGDRRSSAAAVRAAKWVSIAGLLAAVGLWSYLTPYQVVVRFLVTAGALVVMIQAVQVRHYVISAAFGALALLYNPVVPVFSLSGDWQRAAVAASAIPFVASLALRNVKLAHND